jgi:hypothetical protein
MREGKAVSGCLIEDDDGAMYFESLFDLLRVFLGNTLFEYLWHRLDKLLGLNATYSTKKIEKKKSKQQRTSMRVRLGTSALTSLMTLGLAPASNDSSFTLNIVFSFGLADSSSSPAAASSAPAPAAPAPAAGIAAAVGSAISWMFRRVCVLRVRQECLKNKIKFFGGVALLLYLEESDEVCGLEER